ncbi:unnamed protein product [marine sediment metagenome]|uniref:Uncharacterized protein n=1 Tax=marine sediment metagenome TaxID=412755 RepID=X1GRI7_9ZZZZ
MKKLYNFRLEEKLINDVDKIGENRTFVVTSALQHYLQRKDSVGTDDLQCKDDMENDMYNTVYNDLYNFEVLPLKTYFLF